MKIINEFNYPKKKYTFFEGDNIEIIPKSTGNFDNFIIIPSNKYIFLELPRFLNFNINNGIISCKSAKPLPETEYTISNKDKYLDKITLNIQCILLLFRC